jgi:hypothetical protein
MSSFQHPSWKKPAPLGYGAALDAMANIAAPLLAGFSITAIAAVAADSDKFRWPGAALLTLTLAVLLLVASLQFGFHARRYLYSGADVAAWWSPEDLAEPGRSERLERDQHNDFDRWARESSKARGTYNAGIAVLAVGLALVLAPPHSAGSAQAILRWIAAAVAFAGAFGELAWTTVPIARNWLQLRKLLRDNRPAD